MFHVEHYLPMLHDNLRVALRIARVFHVEHVLIW